VLGEKTASTFNFSNFTDISGLPRSDIFRSESAEGETATSCGALDRYMGKTAFHPGTRLLQPMCCRRSREGVEEEPGRREGWMAVGDAAVGGSYHREGLYTRASAIWLRDVLSESREKAGYARAA